MTLRHRLFGIFLWWSVLVIGVWIGGTLYMMLVINPMWSASPGSVEAFFGGTSFTDHILNFFGPLWLLPRYPPVLVAMILGWKYKPHRYYLLVAVVVFVFVVVFTNVYIYSLNAVLMVPHATVGRAAAEIQSLIDNWLFADRLRFAIATVGYLCLLQAFRLPVSGEFVDRCQPFDERMGARHIRHRLDFPDVEDPQVRLPLMKPVNGS